MTDRSTHHAPERPQETPRAQLLWQALRDCPALTSPSRERDQLWFAVRDNACTRTGSRVVPFGSANEVEVTHEHAHDELIAAMDWLYANEARARTLPPGQLFAAVRAVATRGAHGSARAVQADQLHGLTQVPPGDPVRWLALDQDGAA